MVKIAVISSLFSLLLPGAISAPFKNRPKILASVLSMRGGDADADAPLKMFPPLSQEEVLEKLQTIPVFIVTDMKGHPVVISDAKQEGKPVNYIFLQRELAVQVFFFSICSQFNLIVVFGERA